MEDTIQKASNLGTPMTRPGPAAIATQFLVHATDKGKPYKPDPRTVEVLWRAA